MMLDNDSEGLLFYTHRTPTIDSFSHVPFNIFQSLLIVFIDFEAERPPIHNKIDFRHLEVWSSFINPR